MQTDIKYFESMYGFMNHRSNLIVFIAIIIMAADGCRHKSESARPVQMPPTANISVENKPSGNKPVENKSIHEAALNGESDIVNNIIGSGNDINVRDPDGRTALMYAAFNGHADIMEKLISNGAKINLTDNFGRTALMFASSVPNPEAVRILLKNQADPDIADKEEHFTALMYAAAEGQTEVVKILLAFRADPLKKDADGDNALTFARNNGHKEIVTLLQKYFK